MNLTRYFNSMLGCAIQCQEAIVSAYPVERLSPSIRFKPGIFVHEDSNPRDGTKVMLTVSVLRVIAWMVTTFLTTARTSLKR